MWPEAPHSLLARGEGGVSAWGPTLFAALGDPGAGQPAFIIPYLTLKQGRVGQRGAKLARPLV